MSVSQISAAQQSTESTSPLSLLANLWSSVPLDFLLAAADAEVQEVTPEDMVDEDGPVIDWEKFMGYGATRRGGHVALVMPAGRPLAERDSIARDLLARMRGVSLPGQRPALVA